MSAVFVVAAAFLASAVEMVEALTIILAVGITQNWRTSLLGGALALVALGVVVVALGPALINDVPIDGLRVVIGLLLLVFGLQWMRKAVMRASGLKAKHNEDAIFEEEVAELRRTASGSQAIDWSGFVVSFKGVFLEGLEVAFIVLTFGANRGEYTLSVVGATLALVVVASVGLVVHRPLSRVPENAIKFVVGIMLTAFGTFWGGEGIGIEWTLGDGMIPILGIFYAAVAFVMVWQLKAPVTRPITAVAAVEG